MMLARLIATVLLLLPYLAYADIDGTVTLTPEYPAPYSTVVLTLSSYSFDVNVATVTWSVNSKKMLSGIGAKRLTLTTGQAGQTIPVTVQAKTSDGSVFSRSLTIAPQSVDILYESDESYTPPFYEGRSLPSEGAATRVVALPIISENGAVVPPSSLSYSWYMNDEFIDRVSGIGKQSASFLLDYLSDETKIRVLVRSPLGSAVEKTISIAPHPVMPMFYAYDDILGTLDGTAFERRLELTSAITLSLVPYYLSTKNGMEDVATYEWYLDGLPVTPQEKTLLSLRPKQNARGVRTLSVVVDNAKRKLQEARKQLEIVFDTRQ